MKSADAFTREVCWGHPVFSFLPTWLEKEMQIPYIPTYLGSSSGNAVSCPWTQPPTVHVPGRGSSPRTRRHAGSPYCGPAVLIKWLLTERWDHLKSMNVTEFWRQGPDHWANSGISTSPPSRTQQYIGTTDALSRREVSRM